MGMIGIVLTRSAERDIFDIADYIAEQGSPLAAERFVGKLKAECEKLGRLPGKGHFRAEVPRPLKVLNFKNYVIVYRLEKEPVEIVRVLHSRRDFTSIEF
ncbi:MAG: plasmid stabilization system protein ParE [Verrucomicrobiales bacterium]|jgi:plasmid stabilization system protein ParE